MPKKQVVSILFGLHVLVSAMVAIKMAGYLTTYLPSQWKTSATIALSFGLFVFVMVFLFWVLRVTQFVRLITALLVVIARLTGGMNE